MEKRKTSYSVVLNHAYDATFSMTSAHGQMSAVKLRKLQSVIVIASLRTFKSHSLETFLLNADESIMIKDFFHVKQFVSTLVSCLIHSLLVARRNPLHKASLKASRTFV